MKSLTRRIAAVALGGALAVGSLSGCGIFGTAVDCGKLASASQSVTDNVGSSDGLKTAVEEFRAAAKDIDDAELKDATNTFADEAEKFQKYLEDVETDPANAGNPPDQAKMMEAAETIDSKCSGG